ncbi:hypothetical protein ACF1AE_21625 [Streptomyces sp. NPDC014986]|uniref:hypothetical protein n=1 Tax=Streptomyces sp. NPDC014986 TaxID=3364934 RepID=UPI0037020F6A
MPHPSTRHVIQFSGGAGSALTAIRIAERVGPEAMALLIANTQVEDPDLWRFSRDVSDFIGVPLTVVEDGRDPWQLFRDIRFLGNDRFAACTKFLKQIPCREWMEQHAPPETSRGVFGRVNESHSGNENEGHPVPFVLGMDTVQVHDRQPEREPPLSGDFRRCWSGAESVCQGDTGVDR